MIKAFDLLVLVPVVFLVFFAILQQHVLWLRPCWRKYRRWVGSITLFLAIAVLLLGFASTWGQAKESSVMTAIHMLKLDAEKLPSSLLGYIGLSCAVVLWTVLLIELNFILLRDAIQATQLRFVKNHVIICGLGDVGMQLVRQLYTTKKLVVIEKDPNNTYLDDARELGALVLVKDATDDEAMKMAHPEKAVELFGMTGSDNINAAAVALATSIACQKDPAPKSDPQNPSTKPNHRILRCFAHMDNPELVEATSKLSYSSHDSRVDVEFFVPQELAATDMLCSPLTGRLPADLGDRTLHFVLFGFGLQGQSLALQIGELVHLENRKRSRVTVVHDASSDIEGFLSRYPAFAPDLSAYRPEGPAGWDQPAGADSWQGPFDAPQHPRSPTGKPGISFVCNAGFVSAGKELVCEETLAGVEYLLGRGDSLPIVVVCTDDESRNGNLAQRLRDRIEMLGERGHGNPWGDEKIPIFVSVTEHVALHDAMIQSNEFSLECPFPCEMIPWAKTDRVLSYDAIAGSRQRDLAIAITGSYSNKFGEEAEALWSEMPYWERHTNLAAAGHAPFKGRMLGHPFSLARLPESAKPTKRAVLKRPRKEIERVAMVEHNRWVAERLLTGWRYAPLPPLDPSIDDEKLAKKIRKKGTTQRKERHSIVHWDDLPEEEKDKDLSQQQALLDFFNVQLVLT